MQCPLKEDSSWESLQGLLVLQSTSCRLWRIWVPATPQIWLPLLSWETPPNHPTLPITADLSNALGTILWMQTKVNTGCMFGSTFLHQCPHVYWSEHLHVILCRFCEISCKFKPSLKEWLREKKILLHDQPNYQCRQFNLLCSVCYSLLAIVCAVLSWWN